MKSNVDLYLNADRTKVVTEGPDAAYLLVNAGREIPDAEVMAYGSGILNQAAALAGSLPVEAGQAGNQEATASSAEAGELEALRLKLADAEGRNADLDAQLEMAGEAANAELKRLEARFADAESERDAAKSGAQQAGEQLNSALEELKQLKEQQKQADKTEDKAVEAPAEDKAVKAPDENKGGKK